MAKYIVQMRRGTATQWADSDIIPLAGEIVVEIDETNNLHKLKIGDGVHDYSELAYLQAGDEIVTQVLAEVKPRIVTVELTTNWTGADGKYSQVVTLDGITENSRLDLQPNADMLAEFKQLGLAFVTENNGGVITVYSVGDMPLKSYTMQATIVEAECTVENPIIGAPIGGSGSQVDWEQDDDKKADFIKNKPTLLADWLDDENHRTVTDAEKTKLAGIEEGANNYVHPKIEFSTGSDTPVYNGYVTCVGDVIVDECGHLEGLEYQDIILPSSPNNGKLTIQKNGITVKEFTANDSKDVTANITVPTKLSQLENDSGFKTVDNNTTYDLSAPASKSNGSVTIDLTAGGSGSGTDSVKIKGSGATTVTTDANGVITISSTDTNTQDGNDNQTVKAGSVTFGANDVVEFVAGSNVSITGNKDSKKITISATDTTYDIPTVNDGVLTIKQNGVTKGTFTANDADNVTIELTDENDETTLTVTDKNKTDTNDVIYVVTNLVESGTHGHTLTPTYSGLPTKAYVDKVITNGVDYLGTVSSTSGLSTTAGAGDFYRVSTQFTYGSEVAHVGDILLATKANPSTSDWDLIHTESDTCLVTSVAGKTGDVTVTKSDVGLGNVVNTGDSATPVSGGTTKFTTGGAYTELAKKVDKTSLAAVATSGDYSDLINKPKFEFDSTTGVLTITY